MNTDMMNITGYDYRLEAIEQEWTDQEGIGPCGHYAAYRRQTNGWPVAACSVTTADGRYLMSHFVNIVDGAVYDMSNPFSDDAVIYEDLELLNADEMPELVDAESLAAFAAMMQRVS